MATKETTAAPAVASTAAPSMMSLANAFDAEEFGTNLKRIVPASGSIKVAKDNTILGKYIDVQLLSSSERYMIAPVSESNDKEAAKYCRASYDGKTIPARDGGDPQEIDEYIASVDAYPEFSKKKYLDLFVLIIQPSDKDMKELAVDLGMVQISVSPTAIGSYTVFAKQGKLSVLRGVMKAETQNCFRVTAATKAKGNNDWTVFEFAPIPHKDIEDYVPISLTE